MRNINKKGIEMTARHTYSVYYKMYSADEVHHIDVIASNKEEAWDIATYEKIPEFEMVHPYSVWVDSVTYQNGNSRRFNTFEGNPY